MDVIYEEKCSMESAVFVIRKSVEVAGIQTHDLAVNRSKSQFQWQHVGGSKSTKQLFIWGVSPGLVVNGGDS